MLGNVAGIGGRFARVGGADARQPASGNTRRARPFLSAPRTGSAMDGFDDWFEYALDLPPAERERAIAQLRAQDPAAADQLTAMLAECVSNPDFACQTAAPARAAEPPRLLAVTLAVADVPQAARWYAELLRCPVVEQSNDAATLRLPNLDLRLVRGEHAPPALLLRHPDVLHLGAASRAHGTTRELAIVDPWGNALTLRSD